MTGSRRSSSRRGDDARHQARGPGPRRPDGGPGVDGPDGGPGVDAPDAGTPDDDPAAPAAPTGPVHHDELRVAVEDIEGAYVASTRPVTRAGARRASGAAGPTPGGGLPVVGLANDDADRSVAEAPLTVGALAERLGIATSTLRSWDRRYGLGPTDHRAGDRRRYGPADVVRLERMRALTLAGVSPADAARSVMHRSAGRGGLVPASQSATSLDVQSLAAAAAAGDRGDVRVAVARHVDAHGWTATWQRLLAPTCDILAVGDEPQVPGSDGITVLTSGSLEVVRTTVLSTVDVTHRRVVVHATPKHVLAAHVFAAALAEEGVAAHLRRVGRRRVPTGALADLTDRADGVAGGVGVGRAASVRALARAAPERRPAVVLVGPGLPRHVPADAVLASDLPVAVSTVTAMLAESDLG